MADTKVSALSAATAVDADDELYLIEDGNSRRISVAALKAFFDQGIRNASVAQQVFTSGDTYITGSSCAIPNGRLQAKAQYRLAMQMVKTGAGTAAPILNLRVGTAGSTSDASRGTLTFAAQTAVVDEGILQLLATFRTVGSGTSAVIQSLGWIDHRLATTGLSNVNESIQIATSGGFDSTVSNLIIGASLNVGASSNWTVNLVQADLLNLT